MRRPDTLDDAAAMIARMGARPEMPSDMRIALGQLLSLCHTAGPALSDHQFAQLMTAAGILSRLLALDSLVSEICAAKTATH